MRIDARMPQAGGAAADGGRRVIISTVPEDLRIPVLAEEAHCRAPHRHGYVIDALGGRVLFIETNLFTGKLTRLLTDEQYGDLQQFLAARPRAGVVIRETDGLRKLRWAVSGRGKRGGVRVIYQYVTARSQIRMILIYRKGIKDDLSSKDKAALRQLTAEW